MVRQVPKYPLYSVCYGTYVGTYGTYWHLIIMVGSSAIRNSVQLMYRRQLVYVGVGYIPFEPDKDFSFYINFWVVLHPIT